METEIQDLEYSKNLTFQTNLSARKKQESIVRSSYQPITTFWSRSAHHYFNKISIAEAKGEMIIDK